MSDKFADYQQSLESPAQHIYNVTPSDTADITYASRALNVSEAGFVRVTTVGGNDATIFVSAGNAFPVRATRIWDTGTTATGIAVMY